MELFSRKFVDAAASLFERRSSDDVRVLCTIPPKSNHAFVSSLRERGDRELVEVSRENRDTVPNIVTGMLYPDSKGPFHHTGFLGVSWGFSCPPVFLPFFGNLWKRGKKTPDTGFLALFRQRFSCPFYAYRKLWLRHP